MKFGSKSGRAGAAFPGGVRVKARSTCDGGIPPALQVPEKQAGSLHLKLRRRDFRRKGRVFTHTPPGYAQQAFTLVEMIATMAIMMILAGAAIPIARVHAQRTREIELHRALREVRDAIDRFKDFSDRGMIPVEANTYGYPPDLDTLVNGVVLKGASSAKYKFLRRLPVDPMTGKATWGERSMQDDPEAKSWGGENVFDVYSLSPGTALDGTQYSDW